MLQSSIETIHFPFDKRFFGNVRCCSIMLVHSQFHVIFWNRNIQIYITSLKMPFKQRFDNYNILNRTSRFIHFWYNLERNWQILVDALCAQRKHSVWRNKSDRSVSVEVGQAYTLVEFEVFERDLVVLIVCFCHFIVQTELTLRPPTQFTIEFYITCDFLFQNIPVYSYKSWKFLNYIDLYLILLLFYVLSPPTNSSCDLRQSVFNHVRIDIFQWETFIINLNFQNIWICDLWLSIVNGFIENLLN